MKTALLAWALLLCNPFAASRAARAMVAQRAVVTATVYVCMSKGSVAYHASDNCSGLNRCSHPLKAMSEAAAQELGKRACLKCH